MNLPLLLALTCCLGAAATAQEIGRIHLRDDKADGREPSVVIDLTDPDIPSPPPFTELLDPSPAADPADPGTSEPVKVAPAITYPIQPPSDSEPGLAVRVSGFSGQTAHLDPETISLKAPFPAKPLGPTPMGWKLVRADDQVPIFESTAEMAPGSGIQLKIRPHVLIPAADGNQVFLVSEPGYDPALEYRQTATIGALLGNSIRRLEQDDKQMAAAITRLEQLLISLPSPEPPAAEP